jgi:hypothetical protein
MGGRNLRKIGQGVCAAVRKAGLNTYQAVYIDSDNFEEGGTGPSGRGNN